MGMWKRRALNKISILSLYFADLHLNGTIYWYICDQASETLQAMSENNVYILSAGMRLDPIDFSWLLTSFW